jgi:hypothetical protein
MPTERDTVAKIAEQIGGTLLDDNAQWTNRFQIKSQSSDRLYIIAQPREGSVWGCSCPGWRHHRRCKHVTDVLRRLTDLAARVPAYSGLSLMTSARTALLILEPAAKVAKHPVTKGRLLDL